MNTGVLELWFLADSKRAACQGWNWRTPWKSAHHGCPKNLPAVYRILWTIWKKVSGEENCTNNDQEVKWRIGTLNLFVQIKGVQLSEHKGGRLCERLPPVQQACVEAGQKTFRNLIKVWSLFNASMLQLIARAFDDCVVSDSVFKLLNVFGTLLQRRLISLELSDKIPILLDHLSSEMDDAKTIFIKHKVRTSLLSSPCSFLCLEESRKKGQATDWQELSSGCRPTQVRARGSKMFLHCFVFCWRKWEKNNLTCLSCNNFLLWSQEPLRI